MLGFSMSAIIYDTVLYLIVVAFINYWLTTHDAKEYRKLLIGAYSIASLFFNSILSFTILSVIVIIAAVGLTLYGQ